MYRGAGRGAGTFEKTYKCVDLHVQPREERVTNYGTRQSSGAHVFLHCLRAPCQMFQKYARRGVNVPMKGMANIHAGFSYSMVYRPPSIGTTRPRWRRRHPGINRHSTPVPRSTTSRLSEVGLFSTQGDAHDNDERTRERGRAKNLERSSHPPDEDTKRIVHHSCVTSTDIHKKDHNACVSIVVYVT